jgi:hypothetical protein
MTTIVGSLAAPATLDKRAVAFGNIRLYERFAPIALDLTDDLQQMVSAIWLIQTEHRLHTCIFAFMSFFIIGFAAHARGPGFLVLVTFFGEEPLPELRVMGRSRG